jgi:hypothetical protein
MRRPIPLKFDPDQIHDDAVVSLTRAAIAITRNALDRKTSASDYARATWGGDRTVELVLRAASAPAMTTTPAWAGELSHVTLAFLASLRGPTAGADLLGRGLQLRFDGNKTITLPTIALGQVGFVAEGAPIPVRQFTTAPGVSLAPHRLKLITVLTREMVEASDAETIVRAAMSETAALTLDQALFGSTAAVPDLSPAGLLYGVTPLTPSTATPLSEAMVQDLSALAGSVARNAGNDVALVMAPEQSVRANLALERVVYPILASSALAKGTVIAIALPALVSGFAPTPQIEAAREAEMVMDSTPTDVGIASQQTISLFQTDKISLRMRVPIAWALRTAGAIAYLTNVSW